MKSFKKGTGLLFLTSAVIVIAGFAMLIHQNYRSMLNNRTTPSKHYPIETKTPTSNVIEKYTLPPDIHWKQVNKTFKFSNQSYALVLQTSMNFDLGLRPKDNFNITFSGILTADESQKEWVKSWKVVDDVANRKNNPYYMWEKNGQLFVTFVDQYGAGSGEGIMTLVNLSSTAKPTFIDCYYFTGPSTQVDYFEFSKQLDKHKHLNITECMNWTLQKINN